MNFENKVIAVTGGGNGIGREVVLLLLKKGAKVAALDISEEGLNQTVLLAGEYTNNLSIHKVNITSREEVEALPDKIIKEHKFLDGLINVAGIIQPFIPTNSLNYEQIDRVMNVNFYGTLYMVKAFLPYLLKNKTTACIANVSSMGGFLPVPGQSIYGASKAAVKLMTEALYAELKATNIRVSIIFPGGVATNITQNSGVKMKQVDTGGKAYKMTTPQKAGEVIVKGIEKEKFRIIVGSDARIMDILYRLNPKFAVNMITKKMASLLK